MNIKELKAEIKMWTLQAEALREQGLTADTSLEIFCKQKAYALKQQLKKLEVAK